VRQKSSPAICSWNENAILHPKICKSSPEVEKGVTLFFFPWPHGTSLQSSPAWGL
jgi:hypothetical protein